MRLCPTAAACCRGGPIAPRSSSRLTTGTTKLWRNVSFFVCIPVTILGSAWTWKLEKEHHEHLEHLKHENGGELPVRPDYDYLNIR